MKKQIPAFLTGTVRLALVIGLSVFSFSALAEDESNLAEPVPSCVNVCYEEKSGKARRGCPSICQAAENTCSASGGSFEFQVDKYVCSSENIGIAKQ